MNYFCYPPNFFSFFSAGDFLWDFLPAGYEINRPGNELPVFLSDLGSESPYPVRLIMETIHKNHRTKIKHIGSRNFGDNRTLTVENSDLVRAEVIDNLTVKVK
jgi:hypothetical protein